MQSYRQPQYRPGVTCLTFVFEESKTPAPAKELNSARQRKVVGGMLTECHRNGREHTWPVAANQGQVWLGPDENLWLMQLRSTNALCLTSAIRVTIS